MRSFARGVVRYRPKSRHPEPWFAALDLFLYPARFEEFGMVLAEAQAMGVPVLTSRRVGASECLPSAYAPWLLDGPEPASWRSEPSRCSPTRTCARGSPPPPRRRSPRSTSAPTSKERGA